MFLVLVVFVIEPGLLGLTVGQVCARMWASVHTSTAYLFFLFFYSFLKEKNKILSHYQSDKDNVSFSSCVIVSGPPLWPRR